MAQYPDLAQHAAELVAGWPEPTPEQLRRVVAVFLTATPTEGGEADAA